MSDVNNFEKDVARIVEKVVEGTGVLSETNKNRVVVGLGGDGSVNSLYWQPHHFRLYFDFNRMFFNTNKPTLEFGGRFINSTEYEVPDFMEHRVVVKKNTIELGNKVDHKKWYIITLDSTSKVQQVDICLKKARESLAVLREFIRLFGGVSDFRLINFRYQWKIQNEDVVDKLPLKLAYNAELTQKLYNEKNIEGNEPFASINYIENSALRTVQPIISGRLDNIDDSLLSFGEKMDLLADNVLSLSEENKVMALNMSSHIPLVQEATRKLKKDSRVMNSILKIISDTYSSGSSRGVSTSPLFSTRKTRRIKKLLEDWW